MIYTNENTEKNIRINIVHSINSVKNLYKLKDKTDIIEDIKNNIGDILIHSMIF